MAKKIKEQQKEEPETQKPQEEREWIDEKLNYAAADEQIMAIQERVQSRYKEGSLAKGIRDNILEQGLIKGEGAIENSVIMALYMHTAFEVGKEAGLCDVSKLIDETISKMHPETGLEKEDANGKEKTS